MGVGNLTFRSILQKLRMSYVRVLVAVLSSLEWEVRLGSLGRVRNKTDVPYVHTHAKVHTGRQTRQTGSLFVGWLVA